MYARAFVVIAAAATIVGAKLSLASAAGPFTVAVVPTQSFYAFQDSNGNAPADLDVPVGSSVSFSNPSGGGFHDVDFDSAIPSVCTGSASVDSTNASSGPWQGDCTFNTVGTYSFHCSVHGFTGQIVVTDAGGGATGSTGPTASTGGATGASGATTGAGSTGVTQGPSSPQTAEGPSGSTTQAGAQTSQGTSGTVGTRAATIVSLAVTSPARAASVTGTIKLGRGQLTLKAKLQLADSQTVGSLTRRRLGPGRIRFTVALDAQGRRLLRARGSLRLTLIVVVTAADGTRSKRTRTLKLIYGSGV
jgi:plastocyanin